MTDQNGTGISLALVEVLDPGTQSIVASTATDGTGHYVLSIDTGTYEVRVTPPPESGFQILIVSNQVVTPNTILDCVLVPQGMLLLSGHVLDELGGPIAGALVTLQPVGGGAQPTYTAGADGSYQMILAPGSYTFSIHGDPYYLIHPPYVKAPNLFYLYDIGPAINLTTDRVLDFVIPARRISVHVQDPQGNPVPNVVLNANYIGVHNVSLGELTSSYGYTSDERSVYYAPTTDALGNATMWLLPTDSSQYTITASPPGDSGFATFYVRGFAVAGDMTLVIQLEYAVPPNTGPQVSPGSSSAVDEGTPFSRSGSFTDPDPDTWTATVDYGDGSGVQPLILTGHNFTLSHTYGDNGVYQVTVVVADNHDASGSGTFAVTVNNVAPTATFDHPSVVNEGDTVNLSLSAPQDVPADLPTLVYAFDCGVGSGYGSFSANNNASCTTDDNGTQTVKGKIRDKDGGETEYTANIAINNVAPTATFGAPSSANEGSNISLSLAAPSDPSSADTTASFTYSFDCGDGSGYSAYSPGNSADCPTTDNGNRNVRAKIRDKDSGETEYSLVVVINNVAPTGAFNAPSPVGEGSSFSLSLTNPYDPSSADMVAGFTYSFDCGDGTGYGAYGSAFSSTCPTRDNTARAVKGRIRDKDGGITEYTAQVTVNNLPPALDAITVIPSGPIAVGTSVTASAYFTDPGTADTHTASWTWGDNSTSSGIVTESNGSGTASGTYTFAAAGVYTLQLTVTDDDRASDTKSYQYVVVYDTSAGFVTGGGWFTSPLGAYYPDPTLTGRANFGFVSRYLPGKQEPNGVTEFNFQVANLNFHSDTYDWLVISGARAQYRGHGTINGQGNYDFTLTAIDGQVNGGGGTDKLRMRILDHATSTLVYDNQLDALEDADPTTVIRGGSIVIHRDH